MIIDGIRASLDA